MSSIEPSFDNPDTEYM